ncbi:MAG: hypothetical protein B7Z26_02125 [Asticcacaulis sp. 32-58-5]|nr:MAG: hypothetical protein B7Z26_02125 [Asticcacaulis sp. 32-58-5]
MVGASGGVLRSQWSGGHWRLLETIGKSTQIYASVDFSVGGYWSRRSWYYPNSGISLVPVRHEFPARSDLIKLGRRGAVSALARDKSLTHCAFAAERPIGFCLQEGLSDPPEVVAVDGEAWRIHAISPLDARYSSIRPLVSQQMVWRVNDLTSSGFVVFPRDFVAGGRYPAILVTHGYDADDSFAYWGLQWSYPVQLWAERGYVVICVNDVPVSYPPERFAATMQWNTGIGTMPAEQVMQTGWLDHLKIYRKVIEDLAGAGTIDRSRVGIVGYSRGSQMVNVAVSQTDLFRAASSGDGSFFSPTSYWTGGNRVFYSTLFGGAPGNAAAEDNWRKLSPAYRADAVSAAVLFQSAGNKAGMQDFFGALQEAGVPAEFIDFRNETHLFHYPRNRAIAMEQNLDWFDFWLKGERDPSSAKDEQYARWQVMRARWKP